MKKSKRQAVFVIGMHRSGTSICAKALQSLGVYVSEKVLEPNEENPKGFFEDKFLQSANVRLLRQITGNPDYGILPLGYLPSFAAQERTEIEAYIKKEFSNKKAWLFKDPRNCMLFNAWNALLNGREEKVSTIFVYRDPLEVAISLNKRGLSLDYGLSIWFAYNVMGLQQIKAKNSCFVNFKDFFEQPKETLKYLNSFLGLKGILRANACDDFFSNFIDDSLYRSLASDDLRSEYSAKYPFIFELYENINENRDLNQDSINALCSDNKPYYNFLNINQGRHFSSKAQLFLNTSKGFSEENSITKHTETSADSITFDIPYTGEIKSLRFDPCRTLCIVKLVKTEIICLNGSTKEIKISSHNALSVNEDEYTFATNDPQFVFDLDYIVSKITFYFKFVTIGNEVASKILPNMQAAHDEMKRFSVQAEQEKEQAIAQAEQEKEQAIAQAEQEKEQAIAQAEQEKEQALTQAEQEKEQALTQAEQEKEQAIAQAEQEKEQAIAQAEQEKEQAIAQAEQEKEQALTQAEQEKEQALTQAEQEKEQAIAQAEQEKEQALTQAEQEKEQALTQFEQEKEQAIAQAEQEKEQAVAQVEQEKEQAVAQAEQEKEQAIAQVEQEKEQALTQFEQEKEQAVAQVEQEKEQAIIQTAHEREQAIAQTHQEVTELFHNSLSWRITAPLRVGYSLLRLAFKKPSFPNIFQNQKSRNFLFALRYSKFGEWVYSWLPQGIKDRINRKWDVWSKPVLRTLSTKKETLISNAHDEINQTKKNHTKRMHPTLHLPIVEFKKNSFVHEISARNLNSTPLVSIIMPTFNRGYCIDLAIESVLNQTWKNWELIIVDDGSSDNTADVIMPYLADKRFTYYKQLRGGVSAARNRGLSFTTGDYIAYLDTDNVWSPFFLEVMIKGMEFDKVKCAYSGRNEIRSFSQSYQGQSFDWDSLISKNFIDLNVFMHHRSVYSELGGFDEDLFRLVDWDFIIKTTRLYAASYYKFVGCNYYHHDDKARISNYAYDPYPTVRARYSNLVNWESINDNLHRREKNFVSIVIPFIGNSGVTINCLKSIKEHTKIKHEIVLVDNGSHDECMQEIKSFIESWDNVIYVRHASNQNFALGNNTGFAASKGEYVLFLNNDTQVTRGWIDPLLVALCSDDTVGFVQPLLLFPDDTVQAAVIGFTPFSSVPYHLYEGKSRYAPNVNYKRKVSTATGACLLMRAVDYSLINGFDSVYINGCEDTDLCLRVRRDLGKHGIFEPASIVYHFESKSRGRFNAFSINRMIYCRRWNGKTPIDDSLHYLKDGLFPIAYQATEKIGNSQPQLQRVDTPTLMNRSIFDKKELSILVVKPSGIGNMLMGMPALVALKKLLPKAKLHIVAYKAEASIAEAVADKVITIGRDRDGRPLLEEMNSALSGSRYSLVLYPPFTSIGRPTEALQKVSDIHIWHPWINYQFRHEVEHNMDLIRMLGYSGPIPEYRHALTSLPKEVSDIEGYVVIHAGSSDSPHMQKKKWSQNKWRDVISAVTHNLHVVLVGGPEETEQILALENGLSERAKSRVINLCGKLSLNETASVLANSDVFAGNDSGLMHLAAFSGANVVAVFGPTTKAKNGPWGAVDKLKTILPKPEITCAPCYLDNGATLLECNEQRCLESIESEEVINEIFNFVDRGAARLSVCNICGGSSFGLGPTQRLSSTGLPPLCRDCGALERHRALRVVYEALPVDFMRGGVGLQFSDDMSIPRDLFTRLEISIYNGPNSLDIQAIDRESATYDWVICNHVLEHVPDDEKAMNELLRILKPTGMLQFAVPGVMQRTHCIDWGFPDENRHGHFREYGKDLFSRFERSNLRDWSVFEADSIDPVTGVNDVFYFVSKDNHTVGHLLKQKMFRRIW